MKSVVQPEVTNCGDGKPRTRRFCSPKAAIGIVTTAFSRSLDAVLPPWHQQPAHEIQIRQRKQHQRPHRILVLAPEAHRGETPPILDHMEGVLAPCPLARAGTAGRLLPVDQRSTGLSPAVGPVGNPDVMAMLLIFQPLRLIAEELPFLPMQEFAQAGDVTLTDRTRSPAFARSYGGRCRHGPSCRSAAACHPSGFASSSDRVPAPHSWSRGASQ
jgi:hypothetical protein